MLAGHLEWASADSSSHWARCSPFYLGSYIWVRFQQPQQSDGSGRGFNHPGFVLRECARAATQ